MQIMMYYYHKKKKQPFLYLICLKSLVVDFCNSKPCLNNGTCSSLPGTFSCECPSNFNGIQCENRIDGCKINKCQNGRCINTDNGYKCQCDKGWLGTFCDKR